MITELHIEGYRSLKDLTWRPGRLNVLIGPNGGGKSNLLRALQVLQAAATQRLSDHVDREGGFTLMRWDQRAENVTLAVHFGADLFSERGAATRYRYGIVLDASFGGDYTVSNEVLDRLEDIDGTHRVLHLFKRKRDGVTLLDRQEHALSEAQRTQLYREALLGHYGATLDEVSGQVVEPAFALKGISVYEALATGADAPIRRGATARYEELLDVTGENLVSFLHTQYTESREFKRGIDEAMTAAFGREFEQLVFGPEADQRVQFRIRWRSLRKTQSAASLSDGTLKFLYLAAILLNPKAGPVVAVDEPEVGLHPAMQTIVAEYAAEASKRTQVVFTTHSPEFLDAFRDSVPTVTVVECEDGQTKLRTLSGEALKNWVKEFTLGDVLRGGPDAFPEEEEEREIPPVR